MVKITTIKISEGVFNLLELIGVLITVLMAFVFQFVFRELPCPLCLLQRIGFLCMALGFLMNFKFGLRASHYALILLSGLFISFVALRQIALHVIPHTGSYGSAIFGLHLYTWSFVVSMGMVLATVLMMSADRQYEKPRMLIQFPYLLHALFVIVVMLTCANLVSVFLECGVRWVCPENPAHYVL